MMLDRGLRVEQTTVYRWVMAYAPQLSKRCRPHLKPTNDSWRVDKTYIEMLGEWKYLYRAVDSQGNTLVVLSAKRNARAAQRFFRKVLKASDNQKPRVINLDKNAAYPKAFNQLNTEELVTTSCKLRQNKYLNNIVEQDDRLSKKLLNKSLGFKSFHTARKTIIGYEIINMICSCQIQGVSQKDIVSQVKFIANIFGVVA